MATKDIILTGDAYSSGDDEFFSAGASGGPSVPKTVPAPPPRPPPRGDDSDGEEDDDDDEDDDEDEEDLGTVLTEIFVSPSGQTIPAILESGLKSLGKTLADIATSLRTIAEFTKKH